MAITLIIKMTQGPGVSILIQYSGLAVISSVGQSLKLCSPGTFHHNPFLIYTYLKGLSGQVRPACDCMVPLQRSWKGHQLLCVF
jgi:hypothetical protein